MKNRARSEAAWDLLHAHECLCEAHRKLEDKEGNVKDRAVGERFIEAFNAIDDLLARFGHPLAIPAELVRKVVAKNQARGKRLARVGKQEADKDP